MTGDTAESLLDFAISIAEEMETGDEEHRHIMNNLLSEDEELQNAFVLAIRRSYQLLEPFIDADRMDELVVTSGLHQTAFTKYILGN